MKQIQTRLRTIGMVFVLSLVVLPMVVYSRLDPLLHQFLLQSAEEEMSRVTAHLGRLYFPNDTPVSARSISRELARELARLELDPDVLKVRVYDPHGKIAYSTDPKEIGRTVDGEGYRHASEGRVYSRSLQRLDAVDFDETVSRTVVETYMPMLRGGTFIGAFETHHDVTTSMHEMLRLRNEVLAFVAVVSVLLLMVVVGLSGKAGVMLREKEQNDRALFEGQRKLEEANRGLERVVLERTGMLKESERKYRKLVNNALVGVFRATEDGTLTYANRALARMLSADPNMDEAPVNLFSRHRYPADTKHMLQVLDRTGMVQNHEIELFRPDGAQLHVLYNIVKEGEVLSGMVLDITRQRHTERTLERQLQHFRALRAVERSILGTLDLRTTLATVMDQVTTVLAVDAADVLLLDSEAQFLRCAVTKGFRTKIINDVAIRVGESYAGYVAQDRNTLVVPDLQQPPVGAKQVNPHRFCGTHLVQKEGFRSYAAIPLVVEGVVRGVLEVFNRTPLRQDREWIDLLEAFAGQASIAIGNALLFDNLQRSRDDLVEAYDDTITGWARALEYRDRETEGHSQRVTEMTLELARRLEVAEDEEVHIRRGALLHDIGKIGVPDSILLKNSTLSDRERLVMQSHTEIAYQVLSHIEFLLPALVIPYCHHEHWDGRGYPQGLQGDEIPLAARIFAVVDVWDALRSERPYRAAWPEQKVLSHIEGLSGTQFDPRVVTEFLRWRREMRAEKDDSAFQQAPTFA